jgi:hypothetical protein
VRRELGGVEEFRAARGGAEQATQEACQPLGGEQAGSNRYEASIGKAMTTSPVWCRAAGTAAATGPRIGWTASPDQRKIGQDP